MFALLGNLFLGAIKLFLIVLGFLYAGLILMTYRTVGPRYTLKIDLTDPAWTAERFLVWVGVKTLGVALRAGRAVLDTLSEASAQVGEWLISWRSVEFQSEFRSRYL